MKYLQQGILDNFEYLPMTLCSWQIWEKPRSYSKAMWSLLVGQLVDSWVGTKVMPVMIMIHKLHDIEGFPSEDHEL